MDDHTAMQRAIALGGSVLGATSPNPPVGCVILDAHGALAGEGATAPAGGPHAEAAALAAAGDRARGGTACVTLEPCRHTGRTPPCSRALIAAGIVRVVYACPDPNPVAAGGAAELTAAGIEVRAGLLREEAERESLRPWLTAVGRSRPYVTWKYAATLDGRTSAADGTSRWITGGAARLDVHRLRARHDAIAVGSGTVLADDPALTVRHPHFPDRTPLRVALDRRGRIPATARIRDETAPTFITAADPPQLLKELYEIGIRSVLVEGGATLAGAFLAAGLVDQVVAYLAPMVLGAGTPVLHDAGISTIADAQQLQIDGITTIGPDLRVTATVHSAHSVHSRKG
jgi:diaminohydroxyphosphoribosylaminopyrimidine deaminase/5-amino-6-(5-phosphoribosylamino)uracil reductase